MDIFTKFEILNILFCGGLTMKNREPQFLMAKYFIW